MYQADALIFLFSSRREITSWYFHPTSWESLKKNQNPRKKEGRQGEVKKKKNEMKNQTKRKEGEIKTKRKKKLREEKLMKRRGKKQTFPKRCIYVEVLISRHGEQQVQQHV